MIRALRLVHILSIVGFLGSIMAYVVISEKLKTTKDLTHIYLITSYINFAVRSFTIPMMGLSILAGFWLAIQKGYKIFSERWIIIKMAFVMTIVVNAVGMIVPLRDKKEVFALESLQKGVLSEEFVSTQRIEDIFGVTNICLILITVGLTIYKVVQINNEKIIYTP
jgi:Predicted integral membrane protein (DUF2269)